jgi:hypothetical protein
MEPTSEQLTVSSDSDYQAWLGEVEKSRATVSTWLAKAGRVWHLEEMEAEAPPVLRRAQGSICSPATMAGLELAAEDSGLRGRLARRLADAARPRWLALEERGLYLVADVSGVRAVWAGTARERPRVQAPENEGREAAKWCRAGNASTTEPWPWREDRVVLRVGPGNGRKVVIRR